MMTTETSRRNFLKTTSLATGGLLMGVALPGAKLEAMAPGCTLPTTTPSR